MSLVDMLPERLECALPEQPPLQVDCLELRYPPPLSINFVHDFCMMYCTYCTVCIFGTEIKKQDRKINQSNERSTQVVPVVPSADLRIRIRRNRIIYLDPDPY